jgi:hypothetical protein
MVLQARWLAYKDINTAMELAVTVSLLSDAYDDEASYVNA